MFVHVKQREPAHLQKRLPTLREFYQELHRIADGLAPRVRRRFLEAVERVRNSVTLRALQEAVESGSVARVLNTLGIGEMFGAFLEPMAEVLQNIFRDSARATLIEAGFEASLDLLNPRSVDFLRRYQLDLISPVSVNRLGQDVRIVPATIDGIREVIVNAFERGGHPWVQARTIRDLIGLNARQARALEHFRRLQEDEGVRADVIQRRVDAYYRRLLNARARTIARTETIRASNAGQQEAWQQAAEQGLIDATTARRKWIVTPDDRLCPICRAIPGMNPQGAALGAPFRTPIGPRVAPPAHPNCRCATGLMRGTL